MFIKGTREEMKEKPHWFHSQQIRSQQALALHPAAGTTYEGLDLPTYLMPLPGTTCQLLQLLSPLKSLIN